MSVITSVLEIGKAIAEWRNPTRVERATLLRSIEAVEQLLMVLRKQDRYAKFPEKLLKKYEIHFQRQFDSWKDGKG